MINGVSNKIWKFDVKTGELEDALLPRWVQRLTKASEVHKANVTAERVVRVALLLFMSMEIKRSLDNLPGA
jgi:hypothetical protein